MDGKGLQVSTKHPVFSFMAIAAFIGGGLMYLLRLKWRLSFFWAYIIAINVATAVLFSFDKAAAKQGAFRVPEKVLFVLSFLGGSPATFVYSRILRHKSSKGSFQFTFWFIVFCQLVLLMIFRSR